MSRTGDNKLYPSISEGDEKQRLLVNHADEAGVEHHEHHTHEIHNGIIEGEEDSPAHWSIFFVVLPVFCGYACLFALQGFLKDQYHIKSDVPSRNSHLYGTAASFVYIGNLVFRLGHNFIFFWAQPRTRVLISMSLMCVAMGIISLIFFVLKDPPIALVFVAYACGGTAVGTFESNLLSTITPLGKSTKLFAIIAIPTGILTITVGAFAILQLSGISAGWIYFSVMILLVLGMLLFIWRFYRLPSANENYLTFPQFLHQLLAFRHWLPKIAFHSGAYLLDMFALSMFSPGVMLYVYSKVVPFPMFHSSLPANWFFVIYDACFFLGDSLSRRIFYRTRIVVPFIFLLCTIAGIGCVLSTVSLLIPLTGFLIAFGNGSIYAQANRVIDSTVDEKYNLIAFSFWLFLGDIGSVIGSNTISYVYPQIQHLYHVD
eukprot:TRINITY_DN426_c0_g1_i1.p1 TRINITY_DN426_c0_g1~~TRINITY_DN426_c0_g1_i1.p1  ORF type:complete len:430 (-),score=85.90 TRINITY_DN426_c0_g1_i1:322-1611(-)